jgi:hypothetical protein
MIKNNCKPRIVLIIARGEAVRNFLYSETLKSLSSMARITLLSVISDDKFKQRFGSYVEEIIPLSTLQENKFILLLRELILYAHYRWLWTEKVKNKWETLAYQANSFPRKIKFHVWKSFIYLLANRPVLDILSFIENKMSILLNPTEKFNSLFERIKPDLVFNCSHIHAPAGELPIRVAHSMGLRTATFIFSWDNLSSRGRILAPYDYYFVWHRGMRDQLLSIYPSIKKEQVFITGTPQFDYHFRSEYCMSRGDLCERLGLDPARPFILYTTGMDRDFPEEHKHVETIIKLLKEFDTKNKPQLVVRMYIKGISPEMRKLSQEKIPDVIFPPVLWEEKWFTPRYDDLAIYSSLLHHTHLGINPASTVTLELLMLGKPVINIGFDPSGSCIPPCLRWYRHIQFDHFRPIAESGVTKVAYSVSELRTLLQSTFSQPEGREKRLQFIEELFGDSLDGKSGRRVAQRMIELTALKGSDNAS